MKLEDYGITKEKIIDLQIYDGLSADLPVIGSLWIGRGQGSEKSIEMTVDFNMFDYTFVRWGSLDNFLKNLKILIMVFTEYFEEFCRVDKLDNGYVMNNGYYETFEDIIKTLLGII